MDIEGLRWFGGIEELANLWEGKTWWPSRIAAVILIYPNRPSN
jgi:hypothetical protein